MSTPPPGRRAGGPERLYVITGGRSRPDTGTPMDLVTLIVSLAADRPSWRAGLYPEHTAILRMCRRPLSVAEISSYLRLPYSATAILIADLLTAGLVVDRKPVKVTWHDPDLLREVIHGLQRL